MKRLIYAPKAYVFIRSANLPGQPIFDVSSDVVRGSVTRNVNEPSTAEVFLRNRFKKYLRDPATGQQIFLPMDLITIWLQRVAGKPIQVFTGYLDSVPYYQAYPGNCRIKATCTLKKLAYSWFDPGLDFFTQMIDHMHGWNYNAQTGEAQNPTFLYKGTQVNDSNFRSAGGTSAMHDGGFAQLLYDFLVGIAGMAPEDVIISDLPTHLPQVAANLYGKINEAAKVNLDQLGQALGQIMGIKAIQATDAGQTNDGTIPPRALATISQIKKAADGKVPSFLLIFAAICLSNFQASFALPQTKDSSNWGYGLYGLRPKTVHTFGVDSGQFSNSLEASTIEGHTIQEILDPATATEVMVKLLLKAEGPWVQRAKRDDRSAMVTWIEKAISPRKIDPKIIDSAFTEAKKYAGVSVVITGDSAPAVGIDPSNMDFTNAKLVSRLTDQDKKVIRDRYKSSKGWLAAALSWAKDTSTNLTVANIKPGNDSTIIITGRDADLKAFFNALKGHDEIDQVEMMLKGVISTLRKGRATQSGLTGALGSSPLMSSSIRISWPKQPPKLTSAVVTPSTSESTAPTTSGDGKATFEQLAAFSANAAFAAQFSFPTNYLESKFLTGDRALMNDMSVLDAVKQFSQASMRNFMSLPDGRFLAFYPDYFGAVRGPYWWIRDLETINLGIQLNDESLATHVFVVGDTFAADGKIDLFDEVTTRGVATITQAFMLDSFIEGFKADDGKTAQTAPPLGRLKDAYEFLQHYGARPHKEENPIIRNTFYEFLLAWQRFMQLWASQFATDCEFTFQPEVFAGGIIGFPDHDLQMYVENVTHNFDYEGGFSTTATLSSPALIQSSNRPADGVSKPGFALAGNVNSVGVGSG